MQVVLDNNTMKQNLLDIRRLELILTEQKEEIQNRTKEQLCSRNEESLIELDSPQAQVVIGVRRRISYY